MPPAQDQGEFEHPLVLTTPHKKGQKVRDAQWLLVGHNNVVLPSHDQIVLHTLTGRIDGEYGPVTAGATKEAKFELGFPKPDGVFGQTLYEYLTGQVQITPQMETTRKHRMATPTKVKALKLAADDLGYKENNPPYDFSNGTKYGAWYGMNGVAWCAIFISYKINEALGTLGRPTWKYSYVPTIAQDAAEGKNHMSITYAPQPGDLVTYDWDGPNCHVEFFEKELGNGSFLAIGGNTGSSLPSSNGGEVCRSTRYNSQVTHFIRLSL